MCAIHYGVFVRRSNWWLGGGALFVGGYSSECAPNYTHIVKLSTHESFDGFGWEAPFKTLSPFQAFDLLHASRTSSVWMLEYCITPICDLGLYCVRIRELLNRI